MTALTQAYLRQLLSYDPESGLFVWLVTSGKGYEGAIAGHYETKIYGVAIGIGRKRYLAHRLAWFWMTGEWPSAEIDHIDCNRANNKWSNLRLATSAQNKHNRRAYKNNKSGIKGVHWHTQAHKWRAMIRDGRKSYHLGLFETIEAASLAYQAEAKLRFGNFARFS